MKFIFGNKVKVVDGFYIGQNGCVIDYKTIFGEYEYLVEILGHTEGYDFKEIEVWIDEDYLERNVK